MTSQHRFRLSVTRGFLILTELGRAVFGPRLAEVKR
jgi:hypothetical protein